MMNNTKDQLERYSWTSAPEDDDEYTKHMRANNLIEWCRLIEEEQRIVHDLNLRNYQFYSNRYLTSFDWGTNKFNQASLSPVASTTDNVIIQVVDALLAEIGKSRPKAKPVLFGASLKKQRLAKKLDKFLYGEFIRANIYEYAKTALLNAFICGFGCLKIEIESDGDEDDESAKVCVQSIFPDDIIIDNQEYTNTGSVHTLAIRRVLPAKVVKATYNLTDEQLRDAIIQQGGYLTYRKPAVDYVVVVEGYRRSCDGVDGRHFIAIQGVTLKDEPWPYEWLPFCFFHWTRPNKTFYTPSVVEQALPNQIRIIEINNVIHRCQEIVSRPRLLVQQGSKVNPLEINNLNAKIIMYTGTQPVPLDWRAVSPELYNEREREIKICFDKFGLNQYTSGGGLPDAARLDSSAAVREYTGIQNSRLSDPVQRYENFFLDIAKTIIRVVKASGANPKTVWYSGGKKARAEVINWKDVDIEDDAYTLILEAASSFSMTPSAMRDSLEDQLLKGLITPEQYKYELGSPDLDTLNAVASAAYEDLMRVFDLLEEGKYERPNHEQDLVNGVKLGQLRYLALGNYDDSAEDADELNQIKLAYEQWLTEARAILRKASSASVPTQQEQTMPGGTPMAPPVTPNAASMVA